MLKRRKKRATVRLLSPKKRGEGKVETCAFWRQEDIFPLQLDFSDRLVITRSTQVLALLNRVMPPATAAAVGYRCRLLTPPAAMGDLAPPIRLGWWIRSLGPADSPTIVSGFCWPRFQVTYADGGSLPTKIRRGGGIHTFLGRITAEVDPLHGLTGITVLGVD